MPTAKLDSTITIAGLTLRESYTATDEAAQTQDLTITKAQSGSLSTRGGNTSGNATLSADHGISTGDTVDIYWSGGSRRGVTVGTVAGTVVPFSAGSGDNLPIQGTTISVAPVTESSLEFQAEDLAVIAALMDGAGQLVFLDESDVELLALDLTANLAWQWISGNGFDNPIENESSSSTGVASIRVSTSATAADKTFKLGLLRNSI